MAGSDEFKKGLSLAQRNEKARERIAADPERAAARLGMVDKKYDLSGYSDKDIIMAFQGGKFAEDDYSRLTGKPIAAPAPTEPAPTEPKNPANDIGTEPAVPSAPVMESPFELRPEPTSPVFEVPVMPPIEEEAPVFIIGGNTGPFNARDINATIGKRGDMTTDIRDSTFGDYANIGNDFSQTRGSMMFGNSLSLPRRRLAEEGAFAGLRFN
jgi:hypothetical protein